MDTQVSLQIGIDWADQKHDFCLCSITQNSAISASEQSRESGVIASSAQHVHEWIGQLRKRFPDGDFEVCLELSKGQLINVLETYDFIRIYPLNPISADSFRQSLYPSLRKDDATDAALLLEILQKHRGHLRQQSMAPASARLLEGLVQARRKSVDQRTALIQQLTSTLKDYYPQALDMIGEPSEPMSRDFLRKWPSWQELSKAREQTLRSFYYGHRSRSESLIQARLEVKKNSCALTEDSTVIELGMIQTLALVDQLEALSKIILNYDRKIKQLYDAHEKKALIDSLPGAGSKLGPRLLCAMESHTLQCRNASELASYSGIAPIRQSSGKRSRISKRYRRPKFLHQSFIEWAKCSIFYSTWAKAYYQHRKKTLGQTYWSIIRSLAFKWIRILYKCWESGTQYDEDTYMETLIKRGSPYAQKS